MAYGNPRKRAANNIRTTTLPKSLVDQLQSTDDGYRGGYVEKRAKTDRPAFRKDQRKQKRTEKKQRRTHYYQVGHGKDPSVAQVTKKVAKPTPAESKKQTKTAKKPTTTPDDEQAKNSRRLKKLAQTNPNFFSLLTDSQLGGLAGAVDLSDRPKSALQADQEREEKELRRLEKKLGIKKKGESKLPSFLNTDGLDDLFDDIQVGSTRLAPEPHGNAYDAGNARLALDSLDALDNDDSDDMLSESNEVEDDDGMEQLSDEYNSEEFTGFGGLDANEEASDSGVSDVEAVHSRVARARQLDQGHEVDAALHDDQPSTDSSDSDPATPIQGTLAPKNSTPVSHVLQKSVSDLSTSATTSARRYIPPHLRKQESDPASERLAKIRKQVQGLLNRLSESNIESILSQSEDIYRNFPRAEVTSVFATLLLQTLTNRTNLLASFVSLNAAFVAALYRIIGTEAAAHFVQETIEQFDKGYETALQQKSAANPSVLETDAEDPDDDDDADIVGKECVNLIALVCELYNFQ
ncbi:suppressor of glycerol defect, partial [Dispira parvispora]